MDGINCKTLVAGSGRLGLCRVFCFQEYDVAVTSRSARQKKMPASSRLVCLALVGIVGLSMALFGDKGVLRLRQVRHQQEMLLAQSCQLGAANVALHARIDSLQNDDSCLELVARRRLGLVKDGEFVYQFASNTR